MAASNYQFIYRGWQEDDWKIRCSTISTNSFVKTERLELNNKNMKKSASSFPEFTADTNRVLKLCSWILFLR